MGKRTLLVCYTDRGLRKMEEAARILAGTGRETVCLERPRGGAFLGEYWGQVREIVFIGAAGIAVRLCAPYVRDKFQDPAVVVLDEGGQFAVPILSGHMGGANDLARLLSEETGAAAVITTATDVNGRFAVDEFARKAGLVVTDREAAKRVSACILQGEPVGFYSALPVRGPVPEELTAVRDTESLVGFPAAVLVEERPGRAGQTPAHILRLFPRNLTAGMGCRRGVPPGSWRRSFWGNWRNWAVIRRRCGALPASTGSGRRKGFLPWPGSWRSPLRHGQPHSWRL